MAIAANSETRFAYSGSGYRAGKYCMTKPAKMTIIDSALTIIVPHRFIKTTRGTAHESRF